MKQLIWKNAIVSIESVLLTIAMVLTMVACGGEKIDPTEELVQRLTKQELGSENGYTPVETVLDSAFAPFDKPWLVNDLCGIMEKASKELPEDYSSYAKKYKNARSTLDSLIKLKKPNSKQFTDALVSFTGYKTAFDNYFKVLRESMKDFEFSHGIYSVTVRRKEFLGFKATHRFTVTLDGETKTDSMIFLLDSRKEKLVDLYNTRSPFFSDSYAVIDSLKRERLYVK